MSNKKLLGMCVDLTDSLAQLNMLIEKLNFLSDDFTMNYIEKITPSLQGNLFTTELNMVKVMADVIRDYSHEAAILSAPLAEQSENILQHIRQIE